MPASHRPNGRVTPKGVRPAGVTARAGGPGARPDATLGRYVLRNARPIADRRAGSRPPVVRTGHRGDR